VRISKPHTFAIRWLIPRLKRFQRKHPNITVHIAEQADPFVLPGSGFDAAVHFQHPAWTGMHTYLRAPALQSNWIRCHVSIDARIRMHGLDTLRKLKSQSQIQR